MSAQIQTQPVPPLTTFEKQAIATILHTYASARRTILSDVLVSILEPEPCATWTPDLNVALGHLARLHPDPARFLCALAIHLLHLALGEDCPSS